MFFYGMIKTLNSKKRLVLLRGIIPVLFASLFIAVAFLLDSPRGPYVLWSNVSFIYFIGATISLLLGSILLIVGIIRREKPWRRIFLVVGSLLSVVSLICGFLFLGSTVSVTCYLEMRPSLVEPPPEIEEKREKLLNKFQREEAITEEVLKKVKKKTK